MSAARPHPSRAGEPLQATARVRHRGTGRLGRIVDGAPVGSPDLKVLFDGDTTASSVPPRLLTYLDEASPSSSPRA